MMRIIVQACRLRLRSYAFVNLVGYHRKEYNDTTDEVQTPNIDGLVAQGIELNRNYVFKYVVET